MKHRNYLKISAFFLIVLSLACSQSLPIASQSYPSGKIVYQSDQFGNFEILAIQISNKRIFRLTNNSANDVSPTYISTTNQIGFVSDKNNGWGLYTMDMSGNNPTEVMSKKETAIDYPNWSPDGKFVTASAVENCKSPQPSCVYDIYTISDDGTSLINLTKTSASEWVPTWSPDGQKIAFASDRDGDTELYVMNKDGTGVKKLTDNQGYDGRPRWSPDGTKFSFETDRQGGDWDIYIMNSDGSDPKPITENTTGEFSQSWSPDGNWLVYVSNSIGNNEIFIIDINGQNQIRLTNNSHNDLSPVWAP